MIPVKITLRNFMCYRDSVPPLLLEGVHVACLCGENGAGKSALLDAVTWALWGKTYRSGGHDDDLIHLGRDEMEVELEFLAQGDHYRVLRKRERGAGRRSGRTILELALSTGDGFLAVTGNSATETQRKIDDILRMDFQTFVNSAFLVQGRADEFTLKSPDQRKEVLAEILNLRYYDSLAKLASEERQRCEAEARALEASIQELQRELERREEHQARAQTAESGLAQAQQELDRQQAEVQRVRSRKEALEQRQALLKEVRQRRARADEALARLRGRLQDIRKAVEGHEAVLAESEAISVAYARLQAASARKDEWDASLRAFSRLAQDRATLEQAIHRERSRLESERTVLAQKAQDLETRAASLDGAEGQLAQAEDRLRALEALEEEARRKAEEAQSAATVIAGLQAATDQLRREMQEIAAKMRQLQQGRGVCPLCGAPLGEDRCAHVLAQYEAEGRARKKLHAGNVAQVASLELERDRLRTESHACEARLKKERPALQKSIGALQHAIEQARAAASELPAERERVSQMERRLADHAYAPREHQALAEVQASLSRISYDADAHARVRAEYDELRPAEGRHRLLEEARRLLPRERQDVEDTGREIEERQREAAADRQRAADLERELQELPGLAGDLARGEQALASRARDVARLQEELGAARGLLARLAEVERAVAGKRAALARAREEQGVYRDLVEAFGRRGVQALVIESAIPDIEEEANSLLGRMTDNRMHLKLETQTVLRTRDDVRETLEIRVSDELGTRAYETFSGGEAFRVNVALRIALSRLLAKRARAPLPTLFIDEGFGTQDASGRDKLVEAINAIQDQFERILVITHIDELKEQFPVRIEVTKTPQGSTFFLS